MSKFKPNDIVIYNDDIKRTPFLVHNVVCNDKNEYSLSLGLEEYPDVEQDVYTPIEDVIKLSGHELKKAKKIIGFILE